MSSSRRCSIRLSRFLCMIGCLVMLAWPAQVAARSLAVQADVPDPDDFTLQSFVNPWGPHNLQLRAVFEDAGTTVDVTDQVAWSSSDPSIGVVSAGGMFQVLSRGRTLITATLDDLISPPVLVTTVATSDPGTAVRAIAAAAVNDAAISQGMEDLFDLLDTAGFDTTALRSADTQAHYHEEGVNSDGAVVGNNRQAVTHLPGGGVLGFFGIGIHLSENILVYDGNSHTTFTSQDAQDLRAGNLTGVQGRLSNAASTAIHELIHAVIYRCDIDAGSHDEEEALVGSLEILIDRVFQAATTPANTKKAFVQAFFTDVSNAQGGPALLQKLGINDSDGDGIPNILETGQVSYVAPTGSDVTGDGSQADPYRTLQHAYGQAPSGGTIRALPGTYNECVLASGPPGADKPVLFIADAFSTSGDNTVTIIDATEVCDGVGNTPGFAITIGGSDGLLQGFTIRGAGAAGVRAEGNVGILDNIIEFNFGTHGAGVLYTSNNCGYGDSTALIWSNAIRDNTTIFDEVIGSGGLGGGFAGFAQSTNGLDTCLAGNSIIDVRHNTFSGNSIEGVPPAGVGLFGGGLFGLTQTQPGTEAKFHATHNTFLGNFISGPSGLGGAAWLGTLGEGTEKIHMGHSIADTNAATLNGGGFAVRIDNFVQGDHSIELIDLVALNNFAADSGGGFNLITLGRDLPAENSMSLRAHDLVAIGNSAAGGSLGGGGGLWAGMYALRSVASVDFQVSSSSFLSNFADVNGAGAALVLLADSDPENGLGPMSPASASMDFFSNLVADNQLFGSAAPGLMTYQEAKGEADSTLTLGNNTIAGNQGPGAGVQVESFTDFDSGASFEGAAVVLIDSSIMANNDIGIGGPAPGSPGAITTGGTGNLELDITYSDVFGNTTANYETWIGDRTNINGNISQDPLFVDPSMGDYHVPAISPVVDAGNPFPPGPMTDFENNPRTFDGNGDGSFLSDIGADEFLGCVDFDMDGVGLSTSTPFCDLPGIADCDDTNDQLWNTPSEARQLTLRHDQLAGATTLEWTAPLEPGGTVPVDFDTLRSLDPTDFTGAIASLGPTAPATASCVEANGSDMSSTDSTDPGPGVTFYYLILPHNDCGNGSGGTQSNGLERNAGPCL